ncbi:SDR family oxidoreductase [Stratiformator vulcanicus]|uniref:Serine 3-dehydrogenase n=1 Tax=Stratiformator vulcanicus TaxID=2527980 RepID=A0A517QW10_9PLAN|nr:SDR family oxidoreductase [Stratiformator vulcanicus]QDT35849.1 Serine 3-dehydrogenase [Stratiformator vulcanicus]
MKLVVITGATRGLGAAMVKEFQSRGWTVAGCGRSEQHIRELSDQFGSPHYFEAVDVTDRDAVRKWSERVLAEVGCPDLLINNAAIINSPAPFHEIPADEFDRVIDINIKGVANVARVFLPALIDRGSGVVVNLSSGWGRSAGADVSAYNASKFAIEGLTKAIALELPAGMAAVPLSPGVVDTDMLRTVMDDTTSNSSPEHWAKAAVPYLIGLGPEDSGQSLTVPNA